MIEIETTQYLLSLIAGSFFVLTHLTHGWGTFEAQHIAAPIFIIYNIIDIIIGKYWQTNITYLIHHMSIIILGIYFYTLDEFTTEQYLISYYISMGEISSIFNNVRWFYYETEWQIHMNFLFAISFIIFRFISNIGLINYAWQLEDNLGSNLVKSTTIVYTLLNLYWGTKISRKLLGISKFGFNLK